ncbi:MAG: TolC family protein, partial [Chlamydiia bacterium]|nr:TolC family protein [Chlamydiia bacterium]
EILCQRPDVLAAEYNLIAKNALIGAAQALYYPNISLTGAFGQTSQELSNLFTGPAKAWNYTGSLTGPLFTFGNIYGQVEQAKAAAEEALWLYKNSVITAFRDVEDALAAHDYLKKKFDAQEKLVAASGEYVHLAQLQFKGGYSPYFVVLQAQEQYFPAQLSWVQTRVELLNSVISTYQAMGGGWIDCLDYH